MKRFLPIILILSFVSIHAQLRNIDFTEYDLDNGLHVILHQDDSTPIVAVSMMFHVGSKNEKPDRTGFAHFFEHLMFEGSKYMKRGEYDILCQGAGGSNNAFTNQDQTFYYQILPSNQLELGLWMESERLLHLKIDSIGVETQRAVVKEERKQGLDNQPYGSLWEEVFKRAFIKHPYHWTTIGSAQYIDQATLDEFMDFHSTYYVPQNCILTIAGDIDIDATKAMIQKYFADIPIGTKEIYRPHIIEPKKTAEVRDTVYDNIQLPLVIQAYNIPGKGTEDYDALEMLATLLSSGESSRLKKELVDKQQVAYQANSFVYDLEDAGLFVAFGLCNGGIDAEKLESSIQTELDKVKNYLITEQEFQKIRNITENDFVINNSTVMGIANSLADYYMFYHDTNLINKEIYKYMNLTKEDIKRVADKYLTKDNRVVLYYLPKQSE